MYGFDRERIKKLEKRLTEVTVSSLPVVGGGTALGLAM